MLAFQGIAKSPELATYVDMTERRAKLLEMLERGEKRGSPLRLNLMIEGTGVSVGDIQLVMLTVSGSRYPLEVDDIGVINIQGYMPQVREMSGFEIYASTDPGDVKLYGKLVPRLPKTRQLQSEQVIIAVESMNELIRKEAGFLRFIAPKAKGIRAQLPSRGYALVGNKKENSETLHSDEAHWIDVPITLAPDQIEFSEVPIRFDFLM